MAVSCFVIHWRRSTNRGAAMSYAGSQVSAVHWPDTRYQHVFVCTFVLIFQMVFVLSVYLHLYMAEINQQVETFRFTVPQIRS